MQITINDAGSMARVTLAGRLDSVGVESVAFPLAALCGGRTIVIDMARVTFMASIGLRHLVTMAKAMQLRGGGLRLLNPTTAVTEVINASGLSEFLQIERDTAPN